MLNPIIKFCERYYEYFGLVAIIMIFASWYVSSIYSDEYVSKEKDLAQIISEKWSYKRLSSIELSQINQGKTLSFIKNLILKLPEWKKDPDAARFVVMSRKTLLAQEFSDDIREFKESSLRIEYLSEKVETTPEFNSEMFDMVTDINNLKADYGKARKKYTAKQMEIFGESISVDSVTSNKLDSIMPFYDEYISDYEDLKKGSLRYNFQLNQLISTLYQLADIQAKKAKFWKNFTSTFALVIYFLGSILAIFGKWVEVRLKTK